MTPNHEYNTTVAPPRLHLLEPDEIETSRHYKVMAKPEAAGPL